MPTFDCLVLGSGPAGLTAAIYLARYRLSNVVIGQSLGGTLTYAHRVENFPGFLSISGLELAQRTAEQVKALGVEIVPQTISGIEKEGDRQPIFKVNTAGGQLFSARSLIVATGTERQKLGVPGEEEYLGRGISYCVNCDGPFFKNKVAVVVGGADAAVSGAIQLTGFASKVYLVYRGERLRAEPVWVEEALANRQIEVLYKSNIVEIRGEPGQGSAGKVTGVEMDREYQGSKQLAVDGVFIEIGGVPASGLLKPLAVELDQAGYVLVDDWMQTSVRGVFAAGDITTKSVVMQQAIVACAQGAIAAGQAFKYLKDRFPLSLLTVDSG